MAAITFFNCFRSDLGAGKHKFGTDTLCIALTATAPDAALDADLSNVFELANGNGYTRGTGIPTIVWSGADVASPYLRGDQMLWTGGPAAMGPFRYCVLYNNSNADKNLIGWYDIGGNVTLNNGQNFTIRFSSFGIGGAILQII